MIKGADVTRDAANSASYSTGYSIESIKAYLADYNVWLPELVLYSTIGFLLGFLLRNFGRIIISVLAIVLVTLIVLQYTGMMTTSLPEMIGLSGVSSLQDGIDIAILWVKNHVMGVVGLLLGLSLGFKLS
jgi:uncharacterized membrane protein (Fun14 family)